MSKQIGGGLPSWFQLPDDHRFHPAFVQHDASHIAIDIFLGKAKLSDFIGDDYPVEFLVFIETELLTLNTIFRNQAFNQKDAVQLYVGRIDKRIRETMDRLAQNWCERLEAKIYHKIVKLYSFGKYS